jgi:hypothetical protein
MRDCGALRRADGLAAIFDNEHWKRLAAGCLDPERHLHEGLSKATMLTGPRTGVIAGLGLIAVGGEPGRGEMFKAVPPEAGRRPAVQRGG